MQLTIIGQAIIQRIKHILIEEQKAALVAVTLAALVLVAGHSTALAFQVSEDATQNAPEGTQSAPLGPEALQQLVAPIALYPDALVAQILAASTYPTEIVEADRWLKDHSSVKDDKLAKEVDKQSWDPSVKALTPFPSVLANLDTNLSWTSSLGDAYFNQQQDVLDAIQVLRSRAKDAGNLQSNQQQIVTNQGPTIIIEPANPDVAYLPAYDPWLVYGAPIGIYPGYLYDSWVGGPYVSFGLGIGIGGGFWDGFGWGWNSWGFDWRRHNVIFNHHNYVSNSRIFFHRAPGSEGGFRGGQGRSPFQGNDGYANSNRNRGGAFPDGNSNQRMNPVFDSNFGHEYRGTIATPPSMQERQDYRGFGQPGSNTGTRSGAFSGFGQGGIERGSAARGQASLGGGGGIFGGRGGGGFGGGGGMRGGGGGRSGGGRH